MNIREIISEAPIADYELLGDFNKPGSFNDQRDKKLLKSPVHQQKLLKFFEATDEDFRIFPINVPGMRAFTETGAVSPEWIRDVFDNVVKRPDIADRIITGHENSITIVYVSNTGASKVVLTPWMMAHRFGHAVRSKIQTWKLAENYFFSGINDILHEVYGLPHVSRGIDFKYTTYYNALFNVIGMQRSSRQGLITRPYEFLYEIFARYLQSGEVKFNPLPAQLEYGKAAWGRKSALRAIDTSALEDELGSLENTMEIAFNDVLNGCVGRIFVM